MAESKGKVSQVSPIRQAQGKRVSKVSEAEPHNNKSDKANTEKSNKERPEEVIHSEPKRLYRSKDKAMIAGVAAGLAEYFLIDPSIVRLIFVLATVFGGFGIPVYIVLWVVLPSDEAGVIGSHDTVHTNAEEIKNKAESFAEGFRKNSPDVRSRTIVGYILIFLGVIFVLQNFGFFRADIFWPLLLVVIGFLILRS